MPTAVEYNNLSVAEILALSNPDKKSFIDAVFSWSFTNTITNKTYISNSAASNVTVGQGISHQSLDALFNDGNDTKATSLTIGLDDARSIILDNKQYVLLTKEELSASDLGLVRMNSWWTADEYSPGMHYTIDQPGNLNATSTGTDSTPLNALIQVIDLPSSPTYSLYSPVGTVVEGGSVVFTLSTTHVAPGTSINYQITGVSQADIFGGTLNGTSVIDQYGSSQITIVLNNDGITEPNETLILSLDNGVSDSVDIIDGTPVQNTPTWVEFNFENVSQFPGHTYGDGWNANSQAIEFTGANDWVQLNVANQPEGNDGYTLQFLYKFNATTEPYNVLVAPISGGEFNYVAGSLNDRLTNPYGNTDIGSNSSQYVDNDWHVVTSQLRPVNDGTNIDFVKSTWIDGELIEATQINNYMTFVDFSKIILGSPSTGVINGNDNDFIGLIDDLRITFDAVSYADIANYGTTPEVEIISYISQTATIGDLELLKPGFGALNTLVLPDDAGDIYFVFDDDGTGLLLPTDTTEWTELAEAGSVTFKAGFNGIVAGDGNDSLFGSDEHSEVLGPGSFTTDLDDQGNIDYVGGNIVYGGDDDANETVDYVDYRTEDEFATQAVILVSESGVSEERQFNGVVLALEDNNGGNGFATVQRSADQLDEDGLVETYGAFDEISSIEGVLGSLKNDFLDASQIGASGAVLAGFAGNDFLIGSNSDDVLVGGSGNDVLVAGDDTVGVNYLEGGTGRDVIVASDAKDLFFVRIGDGNETSGSSSAIEQVVDFQLSGDSAKFVGRDNLVKDEFLFVSDGTLPVTADFDNATKTLRISSGNNSYYSVTVDIKTESGTPTTSYEDAITQRIVNYNVSAFVVQEQTIDTLQLSSLPTEQVQEIKNNAPDLSGALLAGSAYSSVLADTAQSVTRVGLLRQRMGEIIDKAGIADAVVGGRDDDIIVLSGKGSDIKGDIAIGGQGSDLYEVRMVSDLRSANDPPIPTTEFDKITIREMGARGGNNNFDGILIEGVRDIWRDITLARSSDGKSLEIDYKQFTFNKNGTVDDNDYVQQSQGELNVYKQYDYKAPFYRVEKLALQDADDGTTTIFNLGMNAKAGTKEFTEKISAVEFDTSYTADLKFDGEYHWLVGSSNDIYDLSGLENDAVVMLDGYDNTDRLHLNTDYIYEYHSYESGTTALDQLFVGLGISTVLDTGRSGVLVVARDDGEMKPIDHWMILMSDATTPLETAHITGQLV